MRKFRNFNFFFSLLGRSDLRIKNGLKSICYQKLFSLTPKSREKYDVGMITNLLNIDIHSIGRMIYVIHGKLKKN